MLKISRDTWKKRYDDILEYLSLYWDKTGSSNCRCWKSPDTLSENAWVHLLFVEYTTEIQKRKGCTFWCSLFIAVRSIDTERMESNDSKPAKHELPAGASRLTSFRGRRSPECGCRFPECSWQGQSKRCNQPSDPRLPR